MLCCFVVHRSIYTGWSGQKYYIELATQTFNLVYTGFPVLLLGLFDKDIDDESCMRFPSLYKDGPAGKRLNHWVFAGWVFSAVTESLITFFACIFAMKYASVNGVSPSIFELGVTTFNAITVVVSIRIAMETHQHYLVYQILLFLSVLSLIPFFYAFDAFDANGMRGGVGRMYLSGSYLVVLPLICVAASLRMWMWKVYKRYFLTEPRHVVQEAVLLVPEQLPALEEAMLHDHVSSSGGGGGTGAGRRRGSSSASGSKPPAAVEMTPMARQRGRRSGAGAGAGAGARGGHSSRHLNRNGSSGGGGASAGASRRAGGGGGDPSSRYLVDAGGSGAGGGAHTGASSPKSLARSKATPASMSNPLFSAREAQARNALSAAS